MDSHARKLTNGVLRGKQITEMQFQLCALMLAFGRAFEMMSSESVWERFGGGIPLVVPAHQVFHAPLHVRHRGLLRLLRLLRAHAVLPRGELLGLFQGISGHLASRRLT